MSAVFQGGWKFWESGGTKQSTVGGNQPGGFQSQRKVSKAREAWSIEEMEGPS